MKKELSNIEKEIIFRLVIIDKWLDALQWGNSRTAINLMPYATEAQRLDMMERGIGELRKFVQNLQQTFAGEMGKNHSIIMPPDLYKDIKLPDTNYKYVELSKKL